MIGRVVSLKMQKTAVVLVERTKKHPMYKKTYRQSKKYLADDPMGVKLADIVQIEQIRPMSKLKYFRIVKVVGRDIEAIVEEQLKEEAAEAIEEIMPEEVESEQLEETKKPTKKTKKGDKN